jgi:hypothetical protein
MDEGQIFDQGVHRLRRHLVDGGSSLKALPEDVKVVLGKNIFNKPMWRKRFSAALGIEVGFDSFVEFVETAPPKGLGATVHVLKNLCRDDTEALDLIDAAVRRPEGRPSTVDNVNSNRPDGNSSAQALRSLRDHRPDLHKKVLAKELSPHAAMVKAGFRKKTFTVPEDVDAAADVLIRRFGAAGIAALLVALAKRLDRQAATGAGAHELK